MVGACLPVPCPTLPCPALPYLTLPNPTLTLTLYFFLWPYNQITAEYIFASLATLSEFVVFLYMGMGVFTGRFRDWDWRFIGLAIVFCLVARLFNTFPFSALANLWYATGLL